MIINLSHDEVRRLRNADIRAELTRNHLIAAATRQPAVSPTPPIMRVRMSLRHAITWLAALVAIG